MINLLPNSIREQLRASRTNLILLKYLIIMIFSGTFLGLAFLAVNMNLDSMKIANNNNLAFSNSSSTKISEQIEEARQHLSFASDIIDQQVSYSKILTSLANLLPKGIVVSVINLDDETISQAITIKLRAKSQDNIAKLNSNFQSSHIFSNYSLADSNLTSIDPDYPIDITINTILNRESVK